MLDDKGSNGILKMPYCIGLTGTIASGKSTAAAYFKRMGIDIVDADTVARDLVAPHQPALLEITAHFGSDILTKTGELHRRKLRERIIQHPEEKEWLEACLHPKIRQEIEKLISSLTSPYLIIEIPLLLRREEYPYLNRILLIQSHDSHQISRITRRDSCTKEEALKFLDLQKNNTKTHVSIADDIVENNGSIDSFIKKLTALHHRYLSEAKNSSMSFSVKAEK